MAFAPHRAPAQAGHLRPCVELPRLADHLRPGLELPPLAVEEVPMEERGRGNAAGRTPRGRKGDSSGSGGFIWIRREKGTGRRTGGGRTQLDWIKNSGPTHSKGDTECTRVSNDEFIGDAGVQRRGLFIGVFGRLIEDASY